MNMKKESVFLAENILYINREKRSDEKIYKVKKQFLLIAPGIYNGEIGVFLHNTCYLGSELWYNDLHFVCLEKNEFTAVVKSMKDLDSDAVLKLLSELPSYYIEIE